MHIAGWVLGILAAIVVVGSVLVVWSAVVAAGRADRQAAADGDDGFEVVIGVISTEASGVRRAASLPPVLVSQVLGVTCPQQAEQLVRRMVENFLETAGAPPAEVLVSTMPPAAAPARQRVQHQALSA